MKTAQFLFLTSCISISGCTSTPTPTQRESSTNSHYINYQYIDANNINLTNESQYLAQCKMKNSDIYGVIEPIPVELAKCNGVAGMVKVSFSIMEDGLLSDLVIIETKPKRIFDRNAKRTLNDVVCNPVLQGGNAVKVTHQIITLVF